MADKETAEPGGRVPRELELRVLSLATEERKLTGPLGDVLDVLSQDATTIVIPEAVHQIAVYVGRAAEQLDRGQTGADTQEVQQDMEESAAALADALSPSPSASAQDQPEAGEGGSGGQTKATRLVPVLAELRALRHLQGRVQARTTRVEALRNASGGLPADGADALRALAEQQQEIAALTARLNVSLEEGP